MSVVWSAGPTVHDYNDLPIHLLWSACMHARRVLDLGTPDDHAEIFDQAVSIGVSVEMLVKSTLAGVSFHLLAADTDVDTTLTLAGIPPTTSNSRSIKTLGAESAVNRLNAVTPDNYAIATERCRQLFAIRNDALHMGLVSASTNQGAVLHLVNITDRIFKARAKLNQPGDVATYWGPDRMSLINQLRNTARTAHERELDQLLHRARRAYQTLLERVDYRSDVIAQFASTQPVVGDSEETLSDVCPACKNQAWVVVTVRRGAPQCEVDDNDVPGPRYVERWGTTQYLHCGACQLTIRDVDLLDLAGIPAEVELEPDDATQEEIDAQESAAVESYLADRLWDPRNSMDDEPDDTD